MGRKTLDKILSSSGLILAVVLLLAGFLLSWASSFINDNVSQQLGDQRITMPSGKAIEDPAIKPHLEPYAGTPLDNGDKAKAYADHYILEHMNASSGGKTYSEVSSEYMALSKDKTADPEKVKELGELRQSLFMGNSLRGLLLNAYAFGTMAKVASIAAIVSFVSGGLLLLLSLLGFWHSTKADDRRGGATAATPATTV